METGSALQLVNGKLQQSQLLYYQAGISFLLRLGSGNTLILLHLFEDS